MEWKTVKLGEISKIIAGGDAPKGRISKEPTPEFNVPIYSNGIDKEGLYGYTDTPRIVEPATTITARGTIGVAFRRTRPFFPIVRLISIVGNKEIVNSDYLYYCLKNSIISGDGSVQAQLTVPMISDYQVSLPPLAEQKRIAAILSSLDDKIENNNRINRNLEAQAQALFKSWFVDFEPWGGIMPGDWKETTIGEICKCYLGGTPSRAKAEYWNGEIPWINSGEVNKYRILEGSEYITELGLQKSATKLLPRKTTVLAITGATLGQVSLLEIEACANQSVIGIVQNEKVPYEFIYPLILNDIEQIMLHQTGGAQQHINKDNVESHKLILPTDEVMAKYKAIQAPLFETIANNCFESQRLATMRDTLLPKLMRGEIAL